MKSLLQNCKDQIWSILLDELQQLCSQISALLKQYYLLNRRRLNCYEKILSCLTHEYTEQERAQSYNTQKADLLNEKHYRKTERKECSWANYIK